MVADIGGVFILEPGSVQAVEAFVILPADQEQIRKLEAVRLCLGIKGGSHWGIYVDINLLEADPPLVIGVDTLGYWKLCGELYWSTLSTANTLEDEHREI